MNKIIYFMIHPRKGILSLASHGLLPIMSDERYIRMKFRERMGYDLDLDNPRTFNEKLQWLKLHERKPIYTTMVDKYEAKKYVAAIIGEEYIIPTLGVWDTFDEIDFKILPKRFVLKCTHDSGKVVICKDKEEFDIDKAKKTINKSLKTNFYLTGREWPYKNVKRRIIAEQFMEDSSTSELKDYKLMCFDGKVKCSFVCSDRFSENGLRVTFFDRKWEKMPFERHYPSSEKTISCPINYETMVKLAEKLSNGIPFVRVDFYEINEKPYFGELTFFPGSGLEEFSPVEWDEIIGSWIDIESIKQEISTK